MSPVIGRVWEIKSINGALVGAADLATYIGLLWAHDPLFPARAWIPGIGYTPPPTVYLDPITFAVVNPPKPLLPGVITYQVFNMLAAIAVTASIVVSLYYASLASDVGMGIQLAEEGAP